MGNFKRKHRNSNVEIIGVAVGCTLSPAEIAELNKPRCEVREPAPETLDLEKTVATTKDILQAMDEIIKLGDDVNKAKAAYKEATKRANELTAEIERLREEQLKADAAIKIATENITHLQTFLREKGIKI